jgi:hypothetical protein
LIIALAAVIGLAACSGGGGGGTPTVTGVIINGPAFVVEKGGTIQFSAVVTGSNNPGQTVTWSIMDTGKQPETTINGAGLFTAAADESLEFLTVKAISTADTTKSSTRFVFVYEPGTLPTVESVIISPSAATVAKGGYGYFSAIVNGPDNPPQYIIWSIVQTNKNAATSINSGGGGKLTVAVAESLNSLTVRAASGVDTSKYAEATVNLTAPAGRIITITGMDEALNGEVMSVVILDEEPQDQEAAGQGIVSGGTLSVTPETSWGTWYGTGEYFIMLQTDEWDEWDERDVYLYTGGPALPVPWVNLTVKYNIQQNTPSTIPFNQFKKVPRTRVTITGIDPAYNDWHLSMSLVNDLGETVARSGYGNTAISGGTISFVLHYSLLSISYIDWAESGSYRLQLVMMYNEHDPVLVQSAGYIYTAGQTLEQLEIAGPEDKAKLPRYTFDGTDKTIPFSLFTHFFLNWLW